VCQNSRVTPAPFDGLAQLRWEFSISWQTKSAGRIFPWRSFWNSVAWINLNQLWDVWQPILFDQRALGGFPGRKCHLARLGDVAAHGIDQGCLPSETKGVELLKRYIWVKLGKTLDRKTGKTMENWDHDHHPHQSTKQDDTPGCVCGL
jgi:hypothetical protein